MKNSKIEQLNNTILKKDVNSKINKKDNKQEYYFYLKELNEKLKLFKKEGENNQINRK